jgi:chloramphenicol-sensitive protein RarD
MADSYLPGVHLIYVSFSKEFAFLKKQSHFLAAISAFVVWGFIPFPLRALSEYSSLQILYFRLCLSLLLLLLTNLLFRRGALRDSLNAFRASSRRQQRRSLLLSLAGGVLLSVNWLTFIYVMNHISIQTASFAYLICPILTAVLGFLILKEELRLNQWLAIALSMLSCYLIGVSSLTNLLFSLMVSASYAFYLITQRLVKQYDKMGLLNLQLLISFVLISPLFFLLDARIPTALPFYGWIFVLSTLFTVIPLFLNLYALNELKSGTIGILMYVNPLINFGVAFLYYGESTGIHQMISYALISVSILMYNLPVRPIRPKPVVQP